MIPAQAAEIIGWQPEGDYALDLAKHPERYEKSAPELAALLRSPSLTAIVEEHRNCNDQAASAQQAFKETMQRANLAIFVAAVLSALMMATQIVFGTLPYGSWFAGALGILSAVGAALASMWLFQVRDGKRLETWMSRRAAAETTRLSYFSALAAAGETGNRDLDLLRLEYFRRYQLEVQKNYYRVRGKAHQRSADRTLRLGSYAVLCSAAGAAISGGLSPTQSYATALGCVGVFGAALSGYAGASEGLSQDRRNAERYDRTLSALIKLGGRLGEVQVAVANGNKQALLEFVAAVNDQISLEHRQWLEGSEATKAAEAKLDEALDKAQPAPRAAAS